MNKKSIIICIMILALILIVLGIILIYSLHKISKPNYLLQIPDEFNNIDMINIVCNKGKNNIIILVKENTIKYYSYDGNGNVIDINKDGKIDEGDYIVKNSIPEDAKRIIMENVVPNMITFSRSDYDWGVEMYNTDGGGQFGGDEEEKPQWFNELLNLLEV